MSLSQKALLPVSSPDIRQIMTTVEYGVVGLANDTQANAAAMTIWIAPPM
jgi:hypothetical protein